MIFHLLHGSVRGQLRLARQNPFAWPEIREALRKLAENPGDNGWAKQDLYLDGVRGAAYRLTVKTPAGAWWICWQPCRDGGALFDILAVVRAP